MTSNPMSDIGRVRLDRAHADTFAKFTVLVAMGGVHVTIVLSALALAFVAKLPLLALAWAVAGHLALAVGVMRSWAKSPAISLPGARSERPEGRSRGGRGGVSILASGRSPVSSI